MKSQAIAMAVLDEFADQYDIDVSDDETFNEKCETVREFVEEHDSLAYHTEVELTVTVDITTGIDVDTMLWEDWYPQQADQITADIADHGFGRSSDVQTVEIEEIWDV